MSQPLDYTNHEVLQNPQNPFLPTALRFSIIISGIGILLTIIFFLFDMDTSQMAQNVGFLVLIVGMIVGIREYRDKVNHGFIEYSQVLLIGVAIAVITSVFLSLFGVVYVEFINPDLIEQVIIQEEEKMIEQGMSDEQIEMAISFIRKFSDPLFSIPMSVIIYGILGLIVSAIAGAFIKNSNNL